MLKNVISHKSGTLCGAKPLTLARLYSGTLLIQSQMGQKNLAILTGWSYYRGRLKFHDLRALMTNTPYIAFAFLEQLFSLTNNQNVDITYTN